MSQEPNSWTFNLTPGDAHPADMVPLSAVLRAVFDMGMTQERSAATARQMQAAYKRELDGERGRREVACSELAEVRAELAAVNEKLAEAQKPRRKGEKR